RVERGISGLVTRGYLARDEQTLRIPPDHFLISNEIIVNLYAELDRDTAPTGRPAQYAV
ncbi:MAG: hypothetical protein IT307_19270, partial [Chloroflexi bacterium]|nr:hypothetical protein [Chloroflexota bacterium]